MKFIRQTLGFLFCLTIFAGSHLEAVPFVWSPQTPLSVPWIDSPSFIHNDQVQANVATDASGNAVAVWNRWNGSNFVMQGATLAAAADPSTGWVLTNDIGMSSPYANPSNTFLALDAAGNAITLWVEQIGPTFYVNSSLLSFGSSTWLTTSPLGTTRDTSSVNYSPYCLAVNPAGAAIAIWENAAGTAIEAARLPAATTTWLPVTTPLATTVFLVASVL